MFGIGKNSILSISSTFFFFVFLVLEKVVLEHSLLLIMHFEYLTDVEDVGVIITAEENDFIIWSEHKA